VPDYSDPTPARKQIADDLRARIRAGEFAPGSRLPSNIALSEQYGVATETVRAALEELRAEGVVATQSTRGTYVTTRPADGVQPDLRAVGEQVAELRQEVRELAERADSGELLARIGRIEAILVGLHRRLGFPDPYDGGQDGTEEAAAQGNPER